MNQLFKIHFFTLIKSRINIVLCLIFTFMIPFLLKICLELSNYEEMEVSFNLGELQVIIFLWVLLCLTFFYYRQQKNKIFLQEKMNGKSLGEMFFSRIIVLELWMLVLIAVFHFILFLICGQISIENPAFFLMILLVYFKCVFIISCVYFVVRNALCALIINWSAFSSLQVFLMIMNQELEMKTPSIFSYGILNGLSEGNIVVSDIVMWSVTSIVEIFLFIYLVKHIYKKVELK